MGNVISVILKIFILLVAGGGGGAAAIVMDPWDMFDPVEILSKLPKDFYEQVVRYRVSLFIL